MKKIVSHPVESDVISEKDCDSNGYYGFESRPCHIRGMLISLHGKFYIIGQSHNLVNCVWLTVDHCKTVAEVLEYARIRGCQAFRFDSCSELYKWAADKI